jgi:hypothetical protein
VEKKSRRREGLRKFKEKLWVKAELSTGKGERIMKEL